MQWIMDIPAKELLIDAAAVSERLNRALARGRVLTAAGLVGDRLLAVLESGDAGGRCRIAPFEGLAAEEVSSEICFRYAASFTTVAVFEYNGRPWGIFRTCQPARR